MFNHENNDSSVRRIIIRIIFILFIAGLMLYAQTDSTIQVITAHEDAIPDTIVMNADTPGNFVKNEASDAALDKQSPDSQQIADLFDSLLVDNPDFYKEEYKLLKNRPEACFDTLIQFFRHEPDKDLAFRALAVASFTGNLSHIKVMHEILQNLPEADQTEFRLIINACRINMRETTGYPPKNHSKHNAICAGL